MAPNHLNTINGYAVHVHLSKPYPSQVIGTRQGSDRAALSEHLSCSADAIGLNFYLSGQRNNKHVKIVAWGTHRHRPSEVPSNLSNEAPFTKVHPNPPIPELETGSLRQRGRGKRKSVPCLAFLSFHFRASRVTKTCAWRDIELIMCGNDKLRNPIVPTDPGVLPRLSGELRLQLAADRKSL